MVDSSFRRQEEELEVKATRGEDSERSEKIESDLRKGRKESGGGPSFGEETLPSLVLRAHPDDVYASR